MKRVGLGVVIIRAILTENTNSTFRERRAIVAKRLLALLGNAILIELVSSLLKILYRVSTLFAIPGRSIIKISMVIQRIEGQLKNCLLVRKGINSKGVWNPVKCESIPVIAICL